MYKSQPYYTTQLEDYTKNLYQSLSIFVPEQVDMMKIAQKLNIWLYFAPIGSCAIDRNGLVSIILDNRKSPQEQFEDFGHEIAHLLFHSGNQLNMPKMFLDYQEAKAQNFAMHFCIPTFMLQKLTLPSSRLEATHILSNTFNVTVELANKRLTHYERQMLASRIRDFLRIHYAV
ncbi:MULTISPECIES: ImmA/IrrE family metallo-endopeptidase [unclassified Bacillus (in: firmicutes)]|uniref:ImmA/IrrE family metallo-endopeptidase n=1 Tax=unclassified Bacillus (in: firmicutes) TaxID=185979 RepID=UPI0008E4A840|nr:MULTISPECIES: ImmA/IrrE family metallo-endopeptidase [unclassified Bacillus (in: firmicutes)]SFI03223.1 Zn-dependent peptidase ImmA, M78 family [Bacillus sp. 71mf]SFS81163.1 Zn-dependent peptidase ImmA, M78 family [Bacillus sp. 103mf]